MISMETKSFHCLSQPNNLSAQQAAYFSTVLYPRNSLSCMTKVAAKKKLLRILCSDTLQTQSFKSGDMAWVYIKDDKGEEQSSPRVILSVDHRVGSIVIFEHIRKHVTAAVEDTRAVPDDDLLVTAVQQGIDEFGLYIGNVLGVVSQNDDNEDKFYSPSTNYLESDCDLSFEGPTETINGDRVKMFWPDDSRRVPGFVSDVQDDIRFVIIYNDDDIKTPNMAHETWHFEQSSLQSSSLHTQKVLASNKQEVIFSMMNSL